MKRIVATAIAVLFLSSCSTMFNRKAADGTTQTLAQFTTADLLAAHTIAEQHNATALANCTGVLLKYADKEATTEPAVVGVFSAYAKAYVKLDRFKDGVPEDIHIACAPLLIDGKLMIVRLSALIGSRGLLP